MKTILIAEDIESNFLLVKAILSKKYNLVRAETGQEAIDMFKETNPDLILMDIKMPMMDGIEATKVIRTISKDVGHSVCGFFKKIFFFHFASRHFK